jgi:hypothetical protein
MLAQLNVKQIESSFEAPDEMYDIFPHMNSVVIVLNESQSEMMMGRPSEVLILNLNVHTLWMIKLFFFCSSKY